MKNNEALLTSSSDAFAYKLDLLKWELDSINSIIDRMDNMAKATKNWAILIWAGTVSLSLGDEAKDFRPMIVYFTGIIPLLFWYVDATFRRLQRRSIYRMMKIKEFVNSNDFNTAFQNKDLGAFEVIDPAGRDHRSEESYQRFISLWQVFRFREVMWFYVGLLIISIILGIMV